MQKQLFIDDFGAFGMTDASYQHRANLEQKYSGLIRINPALDRKNVSYQASKGAPFYRWFSYKEAFSAEMVKQFIKQYPKKEATVLDPFAGTCTTLFVANEMGHNSIGIELLPIGEFVFKTRQAALNVDINQFIREVKKIKEMDFLTYPINDNLNFDHIQITKGAFPETNLYSLNAYVNYCDNEISDNNVKQLLLFSCFSILERISFTRKDGQYLRWDTRAGKGRGSFNKGEIWEFERAIKFRLSQMVEDIGYVNNSLLTKSPNSENKMKYYSGSCLDIMPTMEESTIDLIISSPPYCNRYDYTRTYALELVFLGITENKIKDLRQNLLSCTVENKDKIELLKKIYIKNGQMDVFHSAEQAFFNIPALHEILDILENYKGTSNLNNPGIVRMVKNYFYEHSFMIYQMHRLLKNGGRVYYVNDNVRYAGETIPVDLILSEIAQQSGFNVKAIYKLANGKGNSSQQMGVHGREELRKCVYYWEKDD